MYHVNPVPSTFFNKWIWIWWDVGSRFSYKCTDVDKWFSFKFPSCIIVSTNHFAFRTTYSVKVIFSPKIFIKMSLERSLQTFSITWISPTLNLYNMVSLRYLTSQSAVDHVNVNDLIKISFHIPWWEKTF